MIIVRFPDQTAKRKTLDCLAGTVVEIERHFGAASWESRQLNIWLTVHPIELLWRLETASKAASAGVQRSASVRATG